VTSCCFICISLLLILTLIHHRKAVLAFHKMGKCF